MGLLEILALVLIISWLGGFAFDLGGSLIHFLLVAAVIIFLLRYIRRQPV